jgi:hypothetical protein
MSTRMGSSDEADRAHGIERGSQLLRYLDAKG